MKKILGAALLVSGLSASVPALAGGEYKEMRPYVSGLFSYVFEEEQRGELIGGGRGTFEDGKGLQLSVGKAINRWLGIELSAFGTNFSSGFNGGFALREYGLKLDGLVFYSRDPRFSPYFGVGVGSVQTDVKGFLGANTTDPFADAGLGFMKFFEIGDTELGFRADLRYRHIFIKDDAFGLSGRDDVDEAVLKLGLVVPLGDKPVSAPPPAPAPTEEEPCGDADGDGICDSADLCPETPSGVAVDAKGCPVEKQLGAKVKFEDVQFGFDRDDLTDYGKAILDNAAKVIDKLTTRYPNLKVDVSGHTDYVGTDGYNMALSERRANRVKQYLQRKGVDGARISTQAYGETRPKASNDTDEGRALNRRAEVRTREK